MLVRRGSQITDSHHLHRAPSHSVNLGREVRVPHHHPQATMAQEFGDRSERGPVPRQNWRSAVVDHYRERVPTNRRVTPPKRPARMRDEHDSLEPTRDTHERAAPYKHVDGVNTATVPITRRVVRSDDAVLPRRAECCGLPPASAIS